jgi:beta-aspartyl-peptidase (threonine type)
MESTFHLDHGPVTWPAIVVHGGAGTYARIVDGDADAQTLTAEIADAIEASLDAGWEALADASGPVAAVVAAVAYLENHGGFNAGLGSVPTSTGTFEMDAAVMDDSGRAGAVACLRSHSPIRAAAAVLRHGGPILLAGAGADTFAGSASVPDLTPTGSRPPGVTAPAAFRKPLSDGGTVGAVAVSVDGRYAAATSTGGRAGQLPGRIGDSPIPGAGLWADHGCAVSATGTGEAFILAGFARVVADRHAVGDRLTAALRTALEAVDRYGGDGGGIALGADGTWAGAFTTRAMARGVRHAEGRHTTVIG